MNRQQTIKFLTAVVLAGGFAFSATHPAFAVQTFSVVTCALATPTPCVGGTNTSTGPGVQGVSNQGFGNVGQTKFNSTTAANGKSGLLGQDLSTSGTFDEGVRGTSVRGLGVHGISSSRSGVRGDATTAQGVFGSSSSNVGTQGVSVTGNGVFGQSTSTTGSGSGGNFTSAGSGSGINAQASNASLSGNGGSFIAVGNGNGVLAIANKSGAGGNFDSVSGTGVFATANSGGFGNGLQARSENSVGVLGLGRTGLEGEDLSPHTGDVILANGFGANLFRANNSSGTNVFTIANSGSFTAFSGTVGSSTTFTGMTGIGNSVGVLGALSGSLLSPKAGVQGNNTGDAGSIAVRANGFGGRLFVGNNHLGNDVFFVDDAGNLFVQGNVSAHSYSVHGAPTAMLRTRSGGEVTAYGSLGAAPTIEDFGEARLTGGTAYVPLKASIASAIDRNQPYLVFITPQGAVRGTVYVTQKDARGFTVREAGGASSVAFDYRIVAKPLVTQANAAEMLESGATKKPVIAPVYHSSPKVHNDQKAPAIRLPAGIRQ